MVTSAWLLMWVFEARLALNQSSCLSVALTLSLHFAHESHSTTALFCLDPCIPPPCDVALLAAR